MTAIFVADVGNRFVGVDVCTRITSLKSLTIERMAPKPKGWLSVLVAQVFWNPLAGLHELAGRELKGP